MRGRDRLALRADRTRRRGPRSPAPRPSRHSPTRRVRASSIVMVLLAAFTSSLVSCDAARRPTWNPPSHDAARPETHDADAALEAVRRLGCFACHEAGEASARLAPAAAPDLAGIGGRTNPAHLREVLVAKHGARDGAAMPDLLAAFPASERDEAVEDLTHWLASLGGPLEVVPVDLGEQDLERGATLWRELACAACHEGGFDPRTQARKWELSGLARWLEGRDAARHRPRIGLEEEEALALAAWLLRDRLRGGELERARRRIPGLRYDYLEGDFQRCDEEMMRAEPAAVGIAPRPDLGRRLRDDAFAFVFRGQLEIPRDGAWTLRLRSDDGSRLYVDGELAIDNDGLHPPEEVAATLDLAAGAHRIEVRHFEAGGGETLELGWEGPGTPAARVPDEAFFVVEVASPPRDLERLALDPARIERGRRRASELGCSRCHAPVDGIRDLRGAAPPLRDPEAGCLAESPSAPAPRFALDPSRRRLLRDFVEALPGLDGEGEDPRRRALDVLTRHRCLRCHVREGLGGPDPEVLAGLVGDGDWGEEGRRPPRLDEAGRKLRRPWLEAVVAEGRKARPLMRARMPAFGAEVAAEVAAALVAADRPSEILLEVSGGPAAVEDGRRLVGRGGYGCTECHDVGGNDIEGRLTVDLARIHERLRPRWVMELLADPASKNPGTRMPAYFGGATAGVPTILDGDPRRQSEAILAWLAEGESAPLPPGTAIDRGSFELRPVDGPLRFGTFMDGSSARTLCVGFPEGVHLAWDVENARAARLWRGAFMNGRGTWHGRAGALSKPEGRDLRGLPPGPAVALLDGDEQPWPVAAGREAGWRARGHRIDAAGNPTFVVAHRELGLRVEETWTAGWSDGNPGLRRTLRLRAERRRPELRVRLAAGEVARIAAERWRGSGLNLKVAGATARPARDDLVVAPSWRERLGGGFEAEVEVEYSW